MKIGDLVYHSASLKCGEKNLGLIIASESYDHFPKTFPEKGATSYYKVKWLDKVGTSWYDMEEVERVRWSLAI